MTPLIFWSFLNNCLEKDRDYMIRAINDFLKDTHNINKFIIINTFIKLKEWFKQDLEKVKLKKEYER